jgi:hypothetical protein
LPIDLCSKLSLRVRLKKGDTEVEVSGTEKEVAATFKNLKQWLDEFSSLSSENAPSREGSFTPISRGAISTEQIPSIGQAGSGSDAVLRILDTVWGKRPRTIGEIKAALETNAMPYPASTLSGVLYNLVKSGKIRRWKTPTGWVYTSLSKPDEPQQIQNG